MLCPFCRKGTLVRERDTMPIDGILFEALKCPSCKESVIDGGEMARLAKIYRDLRRTKPSMFAKWGNSIAIRIPKSIVDEYKLKPGRPARITKEKNGIRIVPE